MNNILQLKGQLNHQPSPGFPGLPNLPIGKSVESLHMAKLRNELQSILSFWQTETRIKGALVSVYYIHVVAKSNRIKGLLCKGDSDTNESVRGSRFSEDDPIKHIFTHYVKLDVLQESIRRLDICIDIVDSLYSGKITRKHLEAIAKNSKLYKRKDLAKTVFFRVIVDAYYVERFNIDRDSSSFAERSLVTIYRTDVKTSELLYGLGIDTIEEKAIDETTIRLDPDELDLLRGKAPYLISMCVRDLTKIGVEDILQIDPRIVQIPAPDNEPTIGVIDSPFFDNVYFKEWVTSIQMVDENIEIDTQDCAHGTSVSSLIVDGPTINSELDDGCGRFRVRHFGVTIKGPFSSFSILKAIREIVTKNRDIKVWNLSLGSTLEIDRNSISPEAAELDRLQSEYDIIFIIAGTNKKKDFPVKMRIGAPADSINAIVVNAVNSESKPVSYHRVGPVLSFFQKPDVSCFGGDIGQQMRVCTPFGEGFVSGTSYAAPWISRKMAYLIHILGLSREVAKALLIDAAAGWKLNGGISNAIGYGIVPRRIEDIIQTPDDEIRFIITGAVDEFETFTYNIPVPIHNERHPFYARATLCYFPKCSRDQGVDYTSTEMDIHFGRIKEKKGKPNILSINENKQGDEGFISLQEGNARKLYRKWDNIKHIHDVIKTGSRPRQVYGTGLWGFSIKTKERLRSKSGSGLRFGVVVTLKEMNGENRIDDFIKQCMFRGWIVNQIDVENRFEIYNKAEEEVVFD